MARLMVRPMRRFHLWVASDFTTAGFVGKGMMIAVFDGGFMNVDKIPAFHGIKLAGLKDFVVPPSENIFSEMEHGTMVLSIMAANAPNYYVGVAPEASYLLVRCEDERTESLAEEDYWAEAAEYADSVGVDVINSSLGYHDFDDASTSHRYAEQDGQTALISHTASMLADKGIVCVNSAGNDGMGTWKRINFPADAKDIITVGSVNPKRCECSLQCCRTYCRRTHQARCDGVGKSYLCHNRTWKHHQRQWHVFLLAPRGWHGGLSVAGFPAQVCPTDHQTRQVGWQ